MLYGAVGLLCFCTPLLGQGPASDRRKPYGIEVKEKSMAKASYMYMYIYVYCVVASIRYNLFNDSSIVTYDYILVTSGLASSN